MPQVKRHKWFRKRTPKGSKFGTGLLSCGDIRTVWGSWLVKQSLFHRN